VVEPRSELVSLYDEGFAFYRDRLEAARGRWSGPSWWGWATTFEWPSRRVPSRYASGAPSLSISPKNHRL